jgi:hypothetical protein
VRSEPYIVTLAEPDPAEQVVPEEVFRAALAERLADASILRSMSRRRVVVTLPPKLVPELRRLPGVVSVVRDELRHLHGPGQT